MKKLTLGLFFFAVFSCVSFFAASFFVKQAFLKTLRDSGVTAPSFSSIYILKNGLEIKNLKLDQEGFSSIGLIGIKLNWFKLLNGEGLEKLVIKDVALTGEVTTEHGFSFAGFNPPLNRKPINLTSKLIPFDKIVLENVKVDLNSPFGALFLEAKLELEKDIQQTANVTLALWSKQKQLEFSSDIKASLTVNGDTKISAQINDFRTEISDKNFIASRMSGWFDADVPFNKPLKLGGEFTAGLISTESFKLQNFQTRLDIRDNAVRLIGQTALKDQGSLDFSVSGRKEKTWRIAIDRFNFQGDGFTLSGLKGDLDFVSFSPLQTNGEQTLTIENFQHLFHAAPLSATFKIDEGDVKLQLLKAKIAGGSAFLRHLKFSDAVPQSTLYLDQVDLNALLEKTNINGFAMKGVVSGEIPFQIKDGDIVIYKSAHLKSVSGNLHYAPTPMPAFLQGADERMTTVRKALDNLDYDSLDLTFEGPLLGELKTNLTAKGRNQAAFGPRPVHLNLNIEGPLAPAIKQILNVFGSSSTIPSEGTSQ